jgi:hypothetical protein
MEEKKELNLKITIEEANIILAVLNEAPVMKLIRKIQEQGSQQLQPEEEKK